MKQVSFPDEVIIDSFAGGGGASTGIEMATGRPVDIAINHDVNAILMHRANHPFTEHYREDVWAVDPVAAVRGRKVRLLWASPDCKHFSRAKGAALVDKKIRGLAWVVLRWAAKVRPDVIMLENVPEFVTWGPVRRGKPVKSKAGVTYQKWKSQLEALGYVIDTRELVAADYGAPTILKRFCLVARCDGRPIVFPKRTHAPAGSPEVLSGKCKPWRSAAEIMDFDAPVYSIFESKESIKEKYGVNVKRPLKDKTLARVARGLDKFVLKSAKPFIVPIGYGEKKGQEPRGHNIGEPMPTVVASIKHHLCDPIMTPFHMHNNQNAVGTSMEDPVNTITARGQQFYLAPTLIQYHSEQTKKEVRGQGVEAPLCTVDTANRYGLSASKLAPYISQHKFENAAQDVEKPLSTVTAVGAHELIAPKMTPYLVECKYGNGTDRSCEAPLYTITSKDTFGAVCPKAVPYIMSNNAGNVPHGMGDPVPTVTTGNRNFLSAVFVSKYYTGVDGAKADDPLPTVTAIDHNSVTLAHLAHFKGKDKGQSPAEPLMTVTACDGQFAGVRTRLVKWDGVTDLGHWNEVRQLLNTYCGYELAEDDILLMLIDDWWYYISDIGLRMLSPRELYDAMGFPHDYVIDRDPMGNKISRADQVARCGNAVCPAVAEAMVRANLPELAARKMDSMEELREEMCL